MTTIRLRREEVRHANGRITTATHNVEPMSPIGRMFSGPATWEVTIRGRLSTVTWTAVDRQPA